MNLGSRLEGLNKVYATEILIGENTAKLGEKSFLLREIDLVRVVGREQAIRIYELLAAYITPPKERKGVEILCCRARGLPPTVLGRSSMAFQGISGPMAGARPSRTMAERCQITRKPPRRKSGQRF